MIAAPETITKAQPISAVLPPSPADRPSSARRTTPTRQSAHRDLAAAFDRVMRPASTMRQPTAPIAMMVSGPTPAMQHVGDRRLEGAQRLEIGEPGAGREQVHQQESAQSANTTRSVRGRSSSATTEKRRRAGRERDQRDREERRRAQRTREEDVAEGREDHEGEDEDGPDIGEMAGGAMPTPPDFRLPRVSGFVLGTARCPAAMVRS